MSQFRVKDSLGRYLGFTVGPIDAEGCWTTEENAWSGPRWAADANAKDAGGEVVPVEHRTGDTKGSP